MAKYTIEIDTTGNIFAKKEGGQAVEMTRPRLSQFISSVVMMRDETRADLILGESHK